jgi:hypothetical protein
MDAAVPVDAQNAHSDLENRTRTRFPTDKMNRLVS